MPTGKLFAAGTVAALTHDEDQLLIHYRRMKTLTEFELHIQGRFRAGKQEVIVKPTPILRMETGRTEGK